ncbi:hypothetical protein NK6_885 [Bradyrhizobium diazoefficiens]|uniref:Uncharacterized protein n=1 Tax=Bradyrhizobium diazoefficiens TaxID=1355477 RepID=A0A0E3VSK5_9BRAD|nr:hypothetical protein NK6_885 [Bradyrhizobium diazoefficiens]
MKRAVERVQLRCRQGIGDGRLLRDPFGDRRRGFGSRIGGESLCRRLFGPWKYLHDAHG